MQFVTCPNCSESVPQTDDHVCVHCGGMLLAAPAKPTNSPIERLTPEVRQKVKDMIDRSLRPDTINAFLMQNGIEPAELDRVYAHFDVSMQKLRANYKEAWFTIFIGFPIFLLGATMVGGKVFGAPITWMWTFIGGGLTVMGLAMVLSRPIMSLLQFYERRSRQLNE